MDTAGTTLPCDVQELSGEVAVLVGQGTRCTAADLPAPCPRMGEQLVVYRLADRSDPLEELFAYGDPVGNPAYWVGARAGCVALGDEPVRVLGDEGFIVVDRANPSRRLGLRSSALPVESDCTDGVDSNAGLTRDCDDPTCTGGDGLSWECDAPPGIRLIAESSGLAGPGCEYLGPVAGRRGWRPMDVQAGDSVLYAVRVTSNGWPTCSQAVFTSGDGSADWVRMYESTGYSEWGSPWEDGYSLLALSGAFTAPTDGQLVSSEAQIAPTESCDNELDDDLDGSIDCYDPDCYADCDIPCAADDLAWEGQDTFEFVEGQGLDNLGSYRLGTYCSSSPMNRGNGPEYRWRIELEAGQGFRAHTSTEPGFRGAGLYVTDQCAPEGSCHDVGFGEVRHQAHEDQVVYLVAEVDTVLSSWQPFKLQVEWFDAEDCGNNEDDDLDGQVDGDDVDCWNDLPAPVLSLPTRWVAQSFASASQSSLDPQPQILHLLKSGPDIVSRVHLTAGQTFQALVYRPSAAALALYLGDDLSRPPVAVATRGTEAVGLGVSTLDHSVQWTGDYTLVIRTRETRSDEQFQAHLSLRQAEACTDGIDNDVDGLIDCADGDCSWECDRTCQPTTLPIVVPEGALPMGGSCSGPECEQVGRAVHFTIQMDAGQTLRAHGLGPLTQFDAWAGCPSLVNEYVSWPGSGSFHAPEAGIYTVRLRSLSSTPSPAILLDTPVYEDCVNGVDDDFDTLVDCADRECVGHPDCLLQSDDFAGVPHIVRNAPVALEPTVQALPRATNGEWFRSDVWLDEPTGLYAFASVDGTPTPVRIGNTACSDPTCAVAFEAGRVTVEVTVPPDAAPDATYDLDVLVAEPVPDEDCANGIDDDGDGLADCSDPECRDVSECSPPPEFCYDVRHPITGLWDCDSAVCADAPLCQPRMVVAEIEAYAADDRTEWTAYTANGDRVASPYSTCWNGTACIDVGDEGWLVSPVFDATEAERVVLTVSGRRRYWYDVMDSIQMSDDGGETWFAATHGLADQMSLLPLVGASEARVRIRLYEWEGQFVSLARIEMSSVR